jgi:hypothetical protein
MAHSTSSDFALTLEPSFDSSNLWQAAQMPPYVVTQHPDKPGYVMGFELARAPAGHDPQMLVLSVSMACERFEVDVLISHPSLAHNSTKSVP